MTSPHRARTNIEIIVCGFLVSLTLKASLDTTYGKLVPNATTWSELWHAVVTWPSLQLLIFLFTLIRFVYGAYRVHEVFEESPGAFEAWLVAWNMVGTLMLFVLFYLTGLSVQNAGPFYTSLVVVHCWDLLWFIIPAICSNKIDGDLKSVMRRFLAVDLLTVLLLVGLAFANYHLAITGAVVMVLVGMTDLLWNRRFFFHPNSWRSIGQIAEGQ
jgi:hypothetical protein